MLHIDVSVPGLGEPAPLEGAAPLLGEEKQVRVTVIDEDGSKAAFQIPAKRALAVSREIYAAARKADPEGTSLGAILRSALADNT